MKNFKTIFAFMAAALVFAACTPGLKIEDAYSIEGEYSGVVRLITHNDDDSKAYVTIEAAGTNEVYVTITSSKLSNLDIEVTDEYMILEVQDDYARLVSNGTMIGGTINGDVLTLSVSRMVQKHVCDQNNDGYIDEESEYVRDIVSYTFTGTRTN